MANQSSCALTVLRARPSDSYRVYSASNGSPQQSCRPGASWGQNRLQFAAVLYPLHEQIGYPKGIEEIAGPHLILAMVLAEIEELEYIGMPGLEIDGKSTFAFAAALVHVAGGIVEYAQHGDDPIAGAVGAADIGAR